jgi:hypothetical protein
MTRAEFIQQVVVRCVALAPSARDHVSLDRAKGLADQLEASGLAPWDSTLPSSPARTADEACARPSANQHTIESMCVQVCDALREFDMEDLTRIVSWMREMERTHLTAEQICAVSEITTGGYRWGIKRVRRVLRVGVEMGWFTQTKGRYGVTADAVSTLPPFAVAVTSVTRQLGGDPAFARQLLRDLMKKSIADSEP